MDAPPVPETSGVETMSAARSVDLNSDVGERPGPAGLAADAALLACVSSANVACGGHAGDTSTMRVLCELAVSNGVAIGAQVSYVDREGFGRRRVDIAVDVLVAQLQEQWGELADAAHAAGTQVSYMRPHGALYNAALVDDTIAATVVAATPPGTPVLCLAGTSLARAAAGAGHPVVSEIFADRAVTADGLLVSRSEPGSVLADPRAIAERIGGWLRTGHLTSHDGGQVRMWAQSICIHSDTPDAVTSARRIRMVVESHGVVVAPFAGRAAGGGVGGPTSPHSDVGSTPQLRPRGT